MDLKTPENGRSRREDASVDGWRGPFWLLLRLMSSVLRSILVALGYELIYIHWKRDLNFSLYILRRTAGAHEKQELSKVFQKRDSPPSLFILPFGVKAKRGRWKPTRRNGALPGLESPPTSGTDPTSISLSHVVRRIFTYFFGGSVDAVESRSGWDHLLHGDFHHDYYNYCRGFI